MHVQAYLFFDGRCEEAVELYRTAINAEVTSLLRFKDNPEPDSAKMCPTGGEDSVMHCSFRIGDTEILASDGMGSGKPTFAGISLAITVPDEATARQYFAALQEGGGQVQAPLTPTFFSPSFGMVADKFGVSWMIVADAPKS